MEFGERLKELRTSLNCSQKELSEKTGLTLRTIQRIENNEVKPSFYSIKAIGEALKTDLSDFVKKSETKPYEFNFTIKITDCLSPLNDWTDFLIQFRTLNLGNHEYKTSKLEC
jgi:transcriptional regulator with XRE-family HTH domain